MSQLRYKLGVLGLLGLGALPLGTVFTDVINLVFVANVIGILYLMMFAISWDLVSGYTGYFSFGHTFFFAIGGYGTAVLNIHYNVDPLISIPIATGVAFIGGLLLGVPTLRLRGPYLALVTLVAPLFLLQVFVQFNDIFKGKDGFAVSPEALVGTGSAGVISVDSFSALILLDYYIAFGLLVFLLFIAMLVTRSDAGAVFEAIRENEDVVGAMGLHPAKFKIFAFTSSAGMGGLAGAVFVHSTAGHPTPARVLELGVAIEVILMVIIGGMGTISGAIVGAVIFKLIEGGAQTISRGTYEVVLPILEKTPSDLMPVPLFIITMLVVYYMPGGVVNWSVRKGRQFLSDGSDDRAEVAADGGTTPLEQSVTKFKADCKRSLHVEGDED